MQGKYNPFEAYNMSVLTVGSNDLQALMRNPSVEARAQLAKKVAAGYSNGRYSEKEAEIATQIFALLLRDAAHAVRLELAKELCHCHTAPAEIMQALAHDETEIANYVLQHSMAISEEDLLEITRAIREVPKLCAIAARHTLSRSLGLELMHKREPSVLEVLFDNSGAVIDEGGITTIWDCVIEHRSLLKALVQRGDLSYTLAEKLFGIVGDEYKLRLGALYHLPGSVIENATKMAAGEGLAQLLPEENNLCEIQSLEVLTASLHAQGKLTASLMVRALCSGEMDFFEAGMARLSGVPRATARMLMFDRGTLGFRAIYEAGKLPPSFLAAVQVLLTIALKQTQHGRMRRNDFRQRVLESIYKEGYDKKTPEMNTLLAMIQVKHDDDAIAA